MSVNPASPAMARAINDRMALDLLFEHKKLSAPQLRELTGLSRPSVADLLERLQENELIAVVGESGKKRRGPNAKLYGLVPDLAYLAGVDVRLGHVGIALSDITGNILATFRRPIDEEQRRPHRTGRSGCGTAGRRGDGEASHRGHRCSRRRRSGNGGAGVRV